MYSYGSPHTAAQKQDDQHERTFSSYVRIQVVVLKTCLGRWTIGRSGERGSGISVLPARYDDDDDDDDDINSIFPDIIHSRELTETKDALFYGFFNILIVFKIFYYAHAFKNNIHILYLPQDLHIYIHCHPQVDCFVVSQLISVARHERCFQLGSKPASRISYRRAIGNLNVNKWIQRICIIYLC